ncbi:MAG: hypothetical protein H7Y86_00480 [Rhizobacter sp.]|nr:hypothetical protein [Ferruginibacter sp.]
MNMFCTPDAQAYVVGMSYNEGNPKNLGQIKGDTKPFSNKLTATFHTVSSIKPTTIFITAEQDAASQYPGSFQILSTEIR